MAAAAVEPFLYVSLVSRETAPILLGILRKGDREAPLPSGLPAPYPTHLHLLHTSATRDQANQLLAGLPAVPSPDPRLDDHSPWRVVVPHEIYPSPDRAAQEERTAREANLGNDHEITVSTRCVPAWKSGVVRSAVLTALRDIPCTYARVDVTPGTKMMMLGAFLAAQDFQDEHPEQRLDIQYVDTESWRYLTYSRDLEDWCETQFRPDHFNEMSIATMLAIYGYRFTKPT